MLVISELMLGFLFIEAFLNFQITIFFIYDRFFKNVKVKSKFNLLAFYFLFLGISKCVMILNDYLITESSQYFDFIYLLGIGFAILGVIFFVHTSERMLPFNTRHLISISGLLLLFVTYFLPLIMKFPLNFVRIVYYITFPILFLFIFISLIILIIRTIETIRRYIMLIFFGLIIFGLGRGLNTEYFEIIAGEYINLIGIIVTVMGLAIIGFSFRALPSLNELEWHKELLDFYIIKTSNGVCLLKDTFPPKNSNKNIKIDADLLAGGLSGITSLISEIISEKDEGQYLQVIDHMDIKIILHKGRFVTGILVAMKELQILIDKLKLIVKVFEKRNMKSLMNFDGNIAKFVKDRDLIYNIFKLKKIYKS
ncbi:MAG: hypothetical protein EU549_02070 [Promethearchaeota archaeon]|nr:MAG: hypothetical protein EU549_02070 [Candidatus Lokiarchaeota archaeon]